MTRYTTTQVDNALANVESRREQAGGSWTEEVLAAEVRALLEELAEALESDRANAESAIDQASEVERMQESIDLYRATITRVEALPAWLQEQLELERSAKAGLKLRYDDCVEQICSMHEERKHFAKLQQDNAYLRDQLECASLEAAACKRDLEEAKGAILYHTCLQLKRDLSECRDNLRTALDAGEDAELKTVELKAELEDAEYGYATIKLELRELREAGQRLLRVFDEFADMVVPTPETAVYAPPLGEAIEQFRTTLARLQS